MCKVNYELTQNELWNLRNEIMLDSLYISDYENSYGFNPELLSNFFEGYTDELEYHMEMVHGECNYNYLELLSDYDTSNNLWEYYTSLEYDCVNALFVKDEN